MKFFDPTAAFQQISSIKDSNVKKFIKKTGLSCYSEDMDASDISLIEKFIFFMKAENAAEISQKITDEDLMEMCENLDNFSYLIEHRGISYLQLHRNLLSIRGQKRRIL